MTDVNANSLPPSLVPRMLSAAAALRKREAMTPGAVAAAEAEARSLIAEYATHELVAEQVALIKSLLAQPIASPHSFFNR